MHPIAGTFKRTDDDAIDEKATERLLLDAEENIGVMLVDLARNDLSQVCDDVKVARTGKYGIILMLFTS